MKIYNKKTIGVNIDAIFDQSKTKLHKLC